MYGYIIFTAAVAIAAICLSYDSMAKSMKWPVGDILGRDTGLAKITAFITVAWCVLKAFTMLPWWSPATILLAGWFLAFILTMTFRRYVQYIGVIGVFPAFLTAIIYGAGSGPV